MARPKKAWSTTIEEAGVRVRVFERKAGSMLYMDVRQPGERDKQSLGHRDQDLAQQQARALAMRLAEIKNAGVVGPLTLGQVVALHEQHRSPILSPSRQRAVRGMAALLLEHFGRQYPIDDFSQHALDGYVKARTTGTVRSARHRGPAAGVRRGTIRNELHLLATMLRWARGHRVNGKRLLVADPLEGLKVPHEKNMRRPVATEARYQATLAVADQVDPIGRLRTLLVLARHTGRRLSAMCQLRACDVLRSRDAMTAALGAAGLDLAHAAHWPHGAIRWPESTDKLGFESVAPLSAEARAALDAYLAAQPKLGEAPLFPSTGDAAKPVHKVLAGYWPSRAEKLAKLPKLERGGWHAFRRLWASERRTLPAVDVAAAGGWRSLSVMQASYQQADAATVFSVVENTPPAPPATKRSQRGPKRRVSGAPGPTLGP